ncbi:MAG TPA: choice-of-anchor D domain-containing protein [Candidatus Acidoferrales bacterium]|nr:choice-of-anchor D domain-containing protein [Candidatus Acidoferrales bacterium]
MRRTVALLALLASTVLVAGRLFPSARAQQASVAPTSAAPRAVVIASGDQLTDIRGLALGAAGNVFISAEISPAPAECLAKSVAAHVSVAIFSNCASARGEDPSGIAAKSNGAGIFLANRTQNSIRLLDMTTGNVSLEPGANSRGKQSANISGVSASQFTLAGPAGLATNSGGNLYIADRGNNRILRLAVAANDFSSVTHVLDAAAVAADPTSREIFVASPASNRIFKIDAATNDIAVFAGTGALPESPADTASQFPAPVAAAQAALAAPEGVAVDAGGNVFIADTGANAILRVDAKTNLISRVALGSELISPGALAIDRRGNLFVADRGNHRVVEFAGVAQPATGGGVALAPASFNFGDQPTGGTTPQQTFTLTNNSGSALTLATSDFSFSGNDPNDFTQTNNCVPQLATGSSCQIFVTFSPLGAGAQAARAASLMVTDSASSSPQTASLTGTGDDFQLTAANQNATMQTVVPGSPGNYSLSVTPDNVFGGTVTLSCPTRLPDPTLTCSINPAQLTITAGTASSFAVTITTLSGKAPGAIVFRPPPAGGLWSGNAASLTVLLAFALVLVTVVARARKRKEMQAAFTQANSMRRRRAWAISALALLCAAGAAGCYHAPAKYNPTTFPGTYTIDILGTAQNASRAITLTLNVE